MLKIDCLLKNTEVAETVRQIIGHMGYRGLSDGSDVSFRGMYKFLRENGVEIDLATAARIYSEELPVHDSRFTSEKELRNMSGEWFDRIIRAVTLRKPRKGEQEIGDLSPANAAAQTIAKSFTSPLIKDERTKSVLKTLEDLYVKGAKRLLGELPEKADKDNRTSEEIINDALSNESLGYRNLADGTINGLSKLHDEVRTLLRDMTQEIRDAGDHDVADQWENYVKSIEDATYTMSFSKGEVKKVLNEALMDNGFVKEAKDGTPIVDWQALSGSINSYEQLRENVINSLTGKGFSEDVAGKVADSMSKEFSDIRGRLVEMNDRRQSKIQDTWSPKDPAEAKEFNEIVEKRLSEWKNYTGFEGREEAPLTFTKIEAKRIIGNALRNTEQYGMDWGVDKRAVDWVAMAGERPEGEVLSDIVKAQLEKDGFSPEDAGLITESVVRDYGDLLQEDIEANADRLLATQERAIGRERARRKTELQRLAELHDMGIFDKGYNRLLAKVLGIEEHDVQAMNDIRDYAKQMSTLRHLMQGNEFIASTMQREIAHKIQQVIARNIENKTRTLKVASAFNKIYQLENASLVSGYRNLIENHLSGLIEYATTKANMRQKLGKELAGNKKEVRQLLADTWKQIAEGGTEFGLAPYQVGGTQLRVTDLYNLDRIKEADWKDPKTWAKGTASALLTVPRAFLQGTDGMFKTALYRLHFLSGMRDALVNTGQYSKEDATAFLNEAFYGKGKLDAARAKAKDLYDQIGVKTVSRKQINITANDLLTENLLQGYEVTPEMLKDVQESAFKMAGLGMGHESNQPISRVIQSSKLYFQRKEQQAFSKGRYSEAAGNRVWNTLINSIALRFAASQANWAMIKMEQSGLGLITGLYHYNMGKRIKPEELLQPDRLMEQTERYQKARQSAARGLFGIAMNAAVSGVAIPAFAQAFYGDEEDPVQEMFLDMKDNYLAKALFLKTVPVWGLASYLYHTKDSERRALTTASDLVQNITGIGASHSNSKAFAEASIKWGSKREEVRQKGDAEMGKLLANNLPHVPFYKQGKDVLQTIDYFRTGQNPEWHYPENFFQGLLGGGIMEDIISSMPEDSQPEWAQGWHEQK